MKIEARKVSSACELVMSPLVLVWLISNTNRLIDVGWIEINKRKLVLAPKSNICAAKSALCLMNVMLVQFETTAPKLK